MFPLKDDIPTRRFPVLTVAIILINVVVFFGFQEARITLRGGEIDERKTVEYGAIPYEVTHPGKECFLLRGDVACEGERTRVETPFGAAERRIPDELPKRVTGEQPPWWVTLFTSMFMHGGLLHIGGNMLFLWIFGNNVEDSMGRARFVGFYLLGGLAALFAQVLMGPNAAVPTIGASGAIAAVLGGYAVLYPRARVITLIFIIIFFTIVELPALIVLGAWFILQLLYGAAELGQPLGGSGGVAYFAHIGGFLFGLLLIRAFANRAQDDYMTERRIPVY